MVRCIAAIDINRGLATNSGIPWDLPTDRQFFVDQTAQGLILMGYGTYTEFKKPMHDRTNYVATSHDKPLLPGFEAVHDIDQFFIDHKDELINNLGGAVLYETTMDFADELILTQIQADFNCTKFFPEYKDDFELVQESKPINENGVTYTFQTWHRKPE